MKQSPAVYPANVLSDTQNRQQIATVLQSMGFETDDIQHAFNIFEHSYGDKKYDISLLTEIVFQLQQEETNTIHEDEHKEEMQSHSAPNSPRVIAIDNRQNILHQNNFSQMNDNNESNNDKANNEMLSIFNSLEISQTECVSTKLKDRKASSASPHVYPIKRNYFNKTHKIDQSIKEQRQAMDLLQCLDAFKKYTSDETEIIDVLLQTLSNKNNNDVFNNMVNWFDLWLNIKQRKVEWNEFQQTTFKHSCLYNYDEKKHREIKNNLSNHKKNKLAKKTERNHVDDNKLLTKVQRALEYKYDLKEYDLLNKKDKLLITANTYSILQNNKEKTELMITKCNEKLQEINVKISKLEKEKKQYFSALIRTKNKLLFQIQSIKETEISIKELHESTNKISKEMNAIKDTKQCVDKMEKQLQNIESFLSTNFKQRLEPNWNKWSNRDIIIWIKHIESERFQSFDLSQIEESGLSGKDLPQMNDFILRSFKINEVNDRNLLLQNIKRVIQLKPIKRYNENDVQHNDQNKQLCVVCSDDEANHIMIPCGHIASCSKCVTKIKQLKHKKCPFCGNKTTNIIKCFHVGF